MSYKSQASLLDGIIIPNFSCKVLVYGDVMLDRYWSGPVSRISPEAPVPVLQVDNVEDRAGGAANVALNTACLGVDTHLYGVTGNDLESEILRKIVHATGAQAHFLLSEQVSTLKKLRAIARQQQLIRMDFEKHLGGINQAALQADFTQQLIGAGSVIFSDYAKGTLQDVQQLINLARQAGVACCVDPKGQDFRRYRGATILTPNQAELAVEVGDWDSEEQLIIKARDLLYSLDLQALLVTRGKDGMLLFKRTEPKVIRIASRAREVFDVTGAGDTVIAVLAACIAEGVSLEHAARLANLAAGEVVARLGTSVITKAELQCALDRAAHQSAASIKTVDELHSIIRDKQANGRRVVMTNGCFDLLHAGHIRYLEQARALGDCLVVAVNSDASVSRLKGDSRPINPLVQRMQVLSGLSSVDYVVPFGEDTPQALIAKLLPDVLVKGGDYQPQQIAGYKEVLAHGGEVTILDFVDGCSTSGMVDKILQAQDA